MTDKHTAEHSKTGCFGTYWPVCDVYIAHTTIRGEVSISLTEMPFLILQVNFHTSNDFCDWRLLKFGVILCEIVCDLPHGLHVLLPVAKSYQQMAVRLM